MGTFPELRHFSRTVVEAQVDIAYQLPVAGSVALGLGTALCELLFGASTLVTAQLFASARAGYALVGVFIAVAYATRAIGDVTGGALSWAWPIGWSQPMHAYSAERWWPAGLLALATACLLVCAGVLLDRLDAGAGIFAARNAGAAHASGLLQGPIGLAWRLERNTVAGWAFSLFLGVGAGGTDLVDVFYATAALLPALLCCGFAIVAVLRSARDETSGIADLLLATSLTRRRWAAGALTVALGGSAVLVISGGLGLGVGLALATPDGHGSVALRASALGADREHHDPARRRSARSRRCPGSRRASGSAAP